MASQMKWSARTSAACAISTAFDSLADGANASSAAISPSGYLYSDWEIFAGFTGTLPANGYMDVFLLTTLDDTNYADGNSTVDPPVTPDFNFPLRATSGSQRVIQKNVLLPSGSFAVVAINESGCALAAAGNLLRYTFHTAEQV